LTRPSHDGALIMVLKVGTANRPQFGSNWSNSAKCGSRSANWNNTALNLNSNIGTQGVTETKGLTPRLAVSTWLHRSRIHYGGSPGLVGQPDAQESIFT
jgi:hypothetical protein